MAGREAKGTHDSKHGVLPSLDLNWVNLHQPFKNIKLFKLLIWYSDIMLKKFFIDAKLFYTISSFNKNVYSQVNGVFF